GPLHRPVRGPSFPLAVRPPRYGVRGAHDGRWQHETTGGLDTNDHQEGLMAIRLGDVAPNFKAPTTEGELDFHEWKKGSWAVLFSHPKDFTPVCTTELGYTAKLAGDFKARNVKVIGLSVDSVEDHKKWSQDIERTQKQRVNFPMIGDPDRKVA